MPKSPKSESTTDFSAMPAAAPPPPTSYESAIEELDQIIEQMEAGDLPLEASLASYQRGAVLIEYCRSALAKIEQQVKVLEGELLKPFSESQ